MCLCAYHASVAYASPAGECGNTSACSPGLCSGSAASSICLRASPDVVVGCAK
ncbi:hypothetical protein BD413DRAFT_576232 [Trametes elegans]|nr:hypothetical protein BD413DRAFT_576232 [Trametes elegans]